MSGPARRAAQLCLALLAGALTVVAAAPLALPPAGADTAVSLSVARTFTVDLRGNGHGHGMSQYGAEGAALQGLGYRRILRFYYPHTRLLTGPPSRIRVLVTEAGRSVTVPAQRGLHVTGVAGTLPTAGVSAYRLVSGARRGIRLDARRHGRWRTVRTGLPATTAMHRPGPVRVDLQDGTSTAYRGRILAVRRTARGDTGLLTVDDLALDDYVAGVVPRESPASWRPAALRAQAVAARTYAMYEAANAGSGPYDICDTSWCQVYGGAYHYAADGSLLWTEDRAAVTGDEGQYLSYRGAPAFTQFSASDGGWTVDGGMPYLTAHADPYDDAASGDPYLGYQTGVSSSGLAASFGLAKLTGIEITRRDGHGPWGGRVVAAQVTGRTSSGATKTVPVDGPTLQAALGVGTTWLRVDPDHAPQGQLGSVHVRRHRVWVTGWAVDTDHATWSPRVQVQRDGRVVGTFHTYRLRPRIVRHFALRYHRPGFHRRFRVGPGRHRFCVRALDNRGLRPARLGCATVRVPRPHRHRQHRRHHR